MSDAKTFYIEESSHSLLSPSKSKLWLNCPPSMYDARNWPKKKLHPNAWIGTACHKIAEECLLMQCEPENYIGYRVIDKANNNTFTFEHEHVELVDVFVRYCNSLEGMKFYEQEIDLLHRDIKGTADCIVFDTVKSILYIIDLKTGYWPVVAKGNTQLMLYAIGALIFIKRKYNLTPDAVSSTIVHRSRIHTQNYEVSFLRKAYWLALNKANKAYLYSVGTLQQFHKANHKPGDYCRFCENSFICPVAPRF